MKRINFSILLVLLLVSPLFRVPVFAVEEDGFIPNVDITAKAVYLYNMDTGKVIYEKDSRAPMSPASMTKVMTCILALEDAQEKGYNLDSEIVTYPLSVQDELYIYQQENGRVSQAGLLAGEELTMKDCLYALMLPSANEVAMSIALHINGSQAAFVERMNRRAKELGATDSNFVNANGLYDEDHRTTAHDIAKIAEYALTLPGFFDIVNTTSYTVETNLHDSLSWTTTNKMLIPTSSYYYPAVRGIKTGMVPEAGFCLVSTASKDGFTYLLVVMGCGEYNPDDSLNMDREMAFVDSQKIYDWVFDTFRVKTLIEKGTNVGEAELRLSFDQDYVKLMSGERFTSLMPKDVTAANVTYVPYTEDYFDAPVKKGDVVGEVALILSGEEIGRVPLLIAESVEASPALVVLEQVKMITRSFWFKFGAVLFVLLVILYIMLMILRNRRKQRSGYRPKRRM